MKVAKVKQSKNDKFILKVLRKWKETFNTFTYHMHTYISTVSFTLYFLGACHPLPNKYKHGDLFFSYKCPILACLFSSQLFLNCFLKRYLLPLGFLSFSGCLSWLLTLLLAVCLNDWTLIPLLSLLHLHILSTWQPWLSSFLPSNWPFRSSLDQ